MNPLKAIICLFKGHAIDPDESIIVMKDKRNWLCQCHRCGLYEMRDGAISNSKITLTKSQAFRTKMEFERDMLEMTRRLNEQKAGEQESENDFDSPCISCDKYEQGLNDAWEAARKIACDEGIDMNTLCTIFRRGSSVSIIRDYSASEAIAKIKKYEDGKQNRKVVTHEDCITGQNDGHTL